jgi:hypothetical protein
LEDTLKIFIERTGQSTIQVPKPKLSLEDTLKVFMERTGQSTIQVPQPKLSLEEMLKVFMEDTFKAFIHSNSQTMQELKNVTMVDIPAIQEIEDTLKALQNIGQAIAKLEGQFDYRVAELNKMEEEELQSQLMARGHYMIDVDDSNNPHHEHVQATTTRDSEDVVEEIANEPSLEDPLEESCAQFKFDLDLDILCEQAKALLDSTPTT